MKNLLFWISVFLISIYWPISFIFANTTSFLPFFMAGLVLLVGWLLYRRQFKHYYFVFLFLPIIHPVYLIFPLIIFLIQVISTEHNREWRDLTRFPLVLYMVLLIFVSLFTYKTFYAYSIFTPDPLAKDTLIKKISLIPSRNLARIFENKTTVSQEKFKTNLFVFLDPNYYFFSGHPRELGDSQNLSKYHYLAIIPFLLGLFFLPALPGRQWLFTIFLASVITLSLINNPDRFDLILFIPISLICFYGLKIFADSRPKYFQFFSLFFIPVSLIEFISLISK